MVICLGLPVSWGFPPGPVVFFTESANVDTLALRIVVLIEMAAVTVFVSVPAMGKDVCATG